MAPSIVFLNTDPCTYTSKFDRLQYSITVNTSKLDWQRLIAHFLISVFPISYFSVPSFTNTLAKRGVSFVEYTWVNHVIFIFYN